MPAQRRWKRRPYGKTHNHFRGVLKSHRDGRRDDRTSERKNPQHTAQHGPCGSSTRAGTRARSRERGTEGNARTPQRCGHVRRPCPQQRLRQRQRRAGGWATAPFSASRGARIRSGRTLTMRGDPAATVPAAAARSTWHQALLQARTRLSQKRQLSVGEISAGRTRPRLYVRGSGATCEDACFWGKV